MFIVGCHRSGTSMLTGVVRQLIQELGSTAFAEQQLVGANAENPGGFFESQLLVQTSNDLLGLVNASWDRPFLAKPIWKNPQLLDALVPLREQFSHYWHEPWIDKDPRVCLLWEAYSHILLRKPTGVLVVRNPLKVATSLGLRNGFSETKSALLWWLYNFHLLSSTDEDFLHTICDESLIQNNPECIQGLSLFFKRHLMPDLSLSSDQLALNLDSLLRQRFQPSFRRAVPAEPKVGGLLERAFLLWQRWQESGCDNSVLRSGFNSLPAQVLEEYEMEIGQGIGEKYPLITTRFAQRCEIIQHQASQLLEVQSELASRTSHYQEQHQLLKDECDRLQARCEQLKSDFQEISNSNSWRLTAPARWAARKLKGTSNAYQNANQHKSR